MKTYIITTGPEFYISNRPDAFELGRQSKHIANAARFVGMAAAMQAAIRWTRYHGGEATPMLVEAK